MVDHLGPNVLSIVSKAPATGNTETASDAVERAQSGSDHEERDDRNGMWTIALSGAAAAQFPHSA